MRCPNCDFEMKPDAKICPKCGTNITDQSAILGKKPTVSYSYTSSSGGGGGGIGGFIKVWAIIMLILGIVGTIYAAARFGYPKVAVSYYTVKRVFSAKIFLPVLLGGLFVSIDHYLILAGISAILEKAHDIYFYARNR